MVGCIGGIGDARSEHGEVRIPGQSIVALPEGEVLVSFQRDDAGRNVDVPDNLRFEILPVGGGPAVALDEDGGASISRGGTGSRPVAKADVPDAGDYAVSVEARTDAPDATLLLGEGQNVFTNPTARFGLILLAIAAALIFFAVGFGTRIDRRRKRESAIPPDYDPPSSPGSSAG